MSQEIPHFCHNTLIRDKISYILSSGSFWFLTMSQSEGPSGIKINLVHRVASENKERSHDRIKSPTIS